MPVLDRDPAARAIKRLVERTPPRATMDLTPESTVHGLVLGSTNESTTVIDLASHAIARWRIPWPTEFVTDLAAFDVVEGELAVDLERNDLAQPEAVTLADLPRRLGTYRGRRVRNWLERPGQSRGRAPLRVSRAERSLLGVPWRAAECRRSSRPIAARSCCDVTTTVRPGCVSAGSATTCGYCARTRTRCARWRRPDARH